jgi:hypothetical protein
MIHEKHGGILFIVGGQCGRYTVIYLRGFQKGHAICCQVSYWASRFPNYMDRTK